MKKIKYLSILEQFEKDYGQSYKTTFHYDKAEFNLTPLPETLTKAQQQIYNSPVAPRNPQNQSVNNSQESQYSSTQNATQRSQEATLQLSAQGPAITPEVRGSPQSRAQQQLSASADIIDILAESQRSLSGSTSNQLRIGNSLSSYAETNRLSIQEFTPNTQVSLKGSSTIQSAAYWPDKEFLLVSFKSGATYSYSGVPISVVLAWEKSGSPGSFFYYNIRTSFSYQKM